MITRRNLLVAGIAIVGAAISHHYISVPQQKGFCTVEELKQYVPECSVTLSPNHNGSNRTLLVIEYSNYGTNSIPTLIKVLDNKVKVSSIFMEEVYRKGINSDPYGACQVDKSKITGTSLDEIALRGSDEHYYYQLSKEFAVVGLEVPDVWHDVFTLEKMYASGQKLWQYGKKNEKVESELIVLAKTLRTVHSPIPLDFLTKNDVGKPLYTAFYNMEVLVRREHFVKIIDEHLKPNTLGVYIASPVQMRDISRMYELPSHPTIHKVLSEKGIGLATLNFDQQVAVSKRLAK